MSEFLKYIRNLLGFGAVDDTSYIQRRKRRSVHDDYENFSAKLRRLSDRKMSQRNFDNWPDMPSTSKPSLLKYPTRRQNIRPLSMRMPLSNDIIDVSDEDDVVEVSSAPKTSSVLNNLNANTSKINFSRGTFISPATPDTPNTVFRNAKKSIHNCNRFFGSKPKQNGDLNETIRLQEQQCYRELLLKSPSTAAVYGEDSSSCTSALSGGRKTFELPETARSRKIFSLLNEKKTTVHPVVDLTEEKSTKSSNIDQVSVKDSDSDVDFVYSKRKVAPINSLQRILDIEPYMDPKFLTKLDDERKQKKKETERLIQEERVKRDKFSNLNRENISLLLEEKIKNCKISEVIILDEYPEAEEELCFPEFTADQDARINDALKSRNPNRVFAEKFNLRITGHDLKLFNEKEWLNDEVINFYVNLIQQRSERRNMPRVHSFSTFFYPKLMSSGYSSLRRWTKRVDIFSFDIIVVPVHLGFHWCMATIDFRDKSIRYYDSMLGKNNQCLMALENYLREEHRDKKKTEYDTSAWKRVIMKDIPRQLNGSDCGVFSCTFAEFITRNAKILFTQENMPYIRRKMVIEIIEGRLLT
ncbi:hypothetical protein CBL_03245 [Carabus blaptoides fortunei]